MNKPETVTEAKTITLLRAAAAHLAHQRATAGAIPMPDTDPQRYIAIGTPAEIAVLLREDDEPASTASHPARRLRRGDRPTEPLQWEGDAPAATSGDAPTDLAFDIKHAIAELSSAMEYPTLQRALADVLARIERGAAPAPDLESIEQYRMQMAAIGTAALGYWKESDGIKPEYDTVPLRDVAKLYAKYEALARAAAPTAAPAEQVRDKWISVDERLPEEGQRVLVSRFAGRVSNAEHPGYPGVPWVESTRYMVNCSMFECDLLSTGNVTHWMPLPAAPVPAPDGAQGEGK